MWSRFFFFFKFQLKKKTLKITTQYFLWSQNLSWIMRIHSCYFRIFNFTIHKYIGGEKKIQALFLPFRQPGRHPPVLSPRLSTLSGSWSGSPVSPPAAPRQRPRTFCRTSPVLRRATRRHPSVAQTPRGAARAALRPAEESSRRAPRPPRSEGNSGDTSLRREETCAKPPLQKFALPDPPCPHHRTWEIEAVHSAEQLHYFLRPSAVSHSYFSPPLK